MDFLLDLPALLSTIDAKQWLLFALFPFFLMTMVVEYRHYRGTKIYSLKDSLASVTLGGGYLVFELAFYALFVWAIFDWAYEYRLMTIDITPVTFILLYVLVDLQFYLYHHVAHKVRYFWAGHVVHHASEHMNFSAAMRQSPLYPLASMWLFFLPLTFLGFDRVWVFFALALNLAYQFFLHTQWIQKLPRPIEWIFNTPSHHRVHHGRNARYIDRNFGGTFIVFDRLFGTFCEEDPNEKPDYGIIRQVHSFNPAWLTIHEWVDMFRDMAAPGPLWLRMKHLWASPEWQRKQQDGIGKRLPISSN